MSRRGAASLVLGFVLASWLGAAAAQAPTAAAPAPPAELSLEQFLAQRGWSAVQLRENEFGQLEAEVLVNGAHRLRMQVSTSFSKTIIDEAVAKQLGLAIEPSGIEITGAKKQRLGTLRLASLAFGETERRRRHRLHRRPAVPAEPRGRDRRGAGRDGLRPADEVSGRARDPHHEAVPARALRLALSSGPAGARASRRGGR